MHLDIYQIIIYYSSTIRNYFDNYMAIQVLMNIAYSFVNVLILYGILVLVSSVKYYKPNREKSNFIPGVVHYRGQTKSFRRVRVAPKKDDDEDVKRYF